MADNAVYAGRAQLAGIPGSFDVVLYKIQQRGNFTQNFDLKMAGDQWGQDAAWRATNESIEGDWEMKLIGTADATTKANVISGAAFLAPLALVTCSGFDLSWINTTWRHMSGSGITLNADDIGSNTIRVKRYVNATQNTTFAQTPS